MHKLSSGLYIVGFFVAVFGIASMDSQSVIAPVIMILAGGFLLMCSGIISKIGGNEND